MAEPYHSRIRAFKRFHRENPYVWHRFKEMADKLRAQGRRHYSHDTLISVIRFQHDVTTNGNPFKIANEHKAFYGRWYVKQRKCPGFFSFNQMEGEPDEVFAQYREPEA
jgi:hypothetical protein